ncbi:MAG: hypothetical protein HDS81_02725 [Bacteroidales bacterium]|nr:hypothetical protein [Bacteroidales bacterium]
MTTKPLQLMQAGIIRPAACGLLAAVSLGLVGCIDDKYDLSDIDTNVRLQVTNLTLPINLDEIKLNSIISDPKEGDILQIVDGEYALLRTGDFKSDNLKIDPIHITAPTTTPSVAVFVPTLPAGVKAKAAPKEISFFIQDKETSPIEYAYDGVSDDIVEIADLGANWTISYNVTIEAVNNNTSTFELRNIEFQLPAGLDGTPSLGTYDETTGVLTIKEYTVTNNRLDFVMAVTGIDAKQAHVKFDAASHNLEIKTESGVKDGEIVLKIDDIMTSGIPEQLRVTTDLVLSEIDITTFTGKIKYDIDAFNIAPVTLNDLPDVLSQPETDVKLANPQIYINIHNPFAQYGVKASTAFSITPTRDGVAGDALSINNGTFDIAASAESFYCLSPSKPDKYYEGYATATHVPYTKLSDVVAGHGLPSSLDINLNPTTVPVQSVSNFRLGEYAPVEGGYVFFSPLSLGAGSEIIYSSTEDGWADEDLNKLTIQKLEVNTEVTNDLPFDITLSASPLSVSGPIRDVTITPVTIRGGATENIVIRVEGTVTYLDGIEFTANASSDVNTSSLKPSQYLSLKNTKVTVSGYYDDEL